MNKRNIERIIKRVIRKVDKRSPEILLGIGIVGMGSSIVHAVKATPKAIKDIEKVKKEKEVDELTPKETVEATWKNYIPTAVLFTVSTGCLVGSASINYKRNAALATAYTVTSNALKEHKDKMIDIVTDAKEPEIQTDIDSVSTESAKDIVNNTVVICDDGKKFQCLDPLTGTKFESDMYTMKKVEATLNRKLLIENYVSMNDLYYDFGARNVSIGNLLGWNIDDGYIEFDFSSRIIKGIPTIIIEYRRPPKYDYDRLC